MTDLRKAAEAVLERWDSPAWEWKKQGPTADLMASLRTALAAEQPKPEPVAVFDEQMGHPVLLLGSPMLKDKQPLYTAPPATHPGYVIGSHWLETAYSRICAGEAEADVLRDCGWERVDEALRRDAEQGRWLREWLDNNGLLVRAIRGESLAGYEHPDIEALRRDAERYRWLRDKAPPDIGDMASVRDSHDPFEIDAAIDAAMTEGKT